MEDPVSDEKLWSWVDREAPELEAYLSFNPHERIRVQEIRDSIEGLAHDTSIPIPDHVGDYVVKGLLGEGGMGLVLEAEQQDPRRRVAVKIIRGHLASDPSSVARFKREAKVLGRLSHPGIAKVYEAGQTDEGQHYLVMELVRGKPLQEYLRDHELTRSERLRLIIEIAETIHAAHEEGVVHRDLKPSNILLDTQGRPRVLDFGLARIKQGDLAVSSVMESGKLIGTPQFMSPEQIRGETDRIDRRSDVYALGVILFKLLTNKSPYPLSEKPLPEMARIICEEAPQCPETIDSSLRGDITTIVLKALEKDPSRRYQSAKALAEDIRRFLERRPVLARRPTPAYLLGKLVSRHRVACAVIAAAFAIHALVFLLWSSLPERERTPITSTLRPVLSVDDIHADLNTFQRGLEERFAYAKVNGVDFGPKIEGIRKKAGKLTRGAFALELQRVIALFIDLHADVSGLRFPEGYLPFLVEASGDRFVVFNTDRSGFVHPLYPYVTKIDGIEISDWVDATRQFVSKGSAQHQKREGLRFLRYLQFFRTQLGIETKSTVQVELASEGGTSSRVVTLNVSGEFPVYGLWPRVRQVGKVLEGNIGYLRISQMDQDAVDLVKTWMPKVRETDGLIIDVRNNGGGTREALMELFPYFMSREDPPHVVNAAVYRLHEEFGEDHLAPRFAYRENSRRWNRVEREAIRRFRETFEPEWKPPPSEFSDWHFVLLSKSEHDQRYRYDKRVVILLDNKCSSATDIFLGAFKGWREVTLVGIASAGGSARTVSFLLQNSQLKVSVASMASFQPNGKLYDTHGIQPDIVVNPVPEYFLESGPDVFLETALKVLRGQ